MDVRAHMDPCFNLISGWLIEEPILNHGRTGVRLKRRADAATSLADV
jgi:hypothetical protein